MARWRRAQDPAETGAATVDVARLAAATAECDALRAEVAALRNNQSAAIERFELMTAAAGIGLWDMDVVPDDPVNPNNTFNWSQEFRQMLGFAGEHDFP